MEKKPNIRSNQTNAKGPISEARKNQDASGKQWPRNGRRREPFNFTNSKPEPTRSKPSSTRSNFDKRIRPRGDGLQRNFGSSASPSYARLDDANGLEAELNSVYTPGSKKQNLNHLLNFNYTPRERSDPMMFSRTGNYRNYVKKIKYNKEQFLQATCQFVIKSDCNYVPYTICSDTLIDWNFIEQIHVQSAEEPQCPICLYHPVAGKMTRCGHVYCWPCILHYLALSDKTWRKCPICYDAIHVGDLKSAISKPHRNYNVGDVVTLQLMCREKDSLKVAKASKPKFSGLPHLFGDEDEIIHSKLILADPHEVMAIIDRERNELNSQLTSDGSDCPESIFIHKALDLLQDRQFNISDLIIKSGEHKKSQSDQEIIEHKMEKLELKHLDDKDDDMIHAIPDIPTDFYISADSNLTLHDVDITPAINDSKYFYFYQSSDGQHLYMHSINIRMLQLMYGSLDKAPHTIRGKIVQKESCSMTEDLRKRLKYLQHLPVTSQFDVVELAIEQPIVSADVLAKFKDELGNRHKMRQRREREERQREKHINEVNDRQIGKIMARSANIDVSSNRHFPSCGSYESPTYNIHDPPFIPNSPTTSSDYSSPQAQISAGPSFATMLTAVSQAASLWPTLSPTKNLVFDTPAKLVQVTGSKQSPIKTNQYVDYDGYDMDDEDIARAPEFKSSFGTAIAEALQNKTTESVVVGSSKKRKNKKTILFSTGGRAFNGN